MSPKTEKPRIKYIAFTAAILFVLPVLVFGAYYLGKQSSKNITEKNKYQSFPSPTLNKTDITVGWKTYNSINTSITFKYPEDWQAEREMIFGSRTITEFKYNNTPIFELTVHKNYNQDTGGTYKNLAEFLGPRSNKSKDTLVHGQPAKRIEDQGDFGHVVPYEEVVFFTPDNKSIVSLYYKGPKANDVLDKIISTFIFLNK